MKTVDAHGQQTRFWHDGLGNAKLIEDALLNLYGAKYIGLGQRSRLYDPDMGSWNI